MLAITLTADAVTLADSNLLRAVLDVFEITTREVNAVTSSRLTTVTMLFPTYLKNRFVTLLPKAVKVITSYPFTVTLNLRDLKNVLLVLQKR